MKSADFNHLAYRKAPMEIMKHDDRNAIILSV